MIKNKKLIYGTIFTIVLVVLITACNKSRGALTLEEVKKIQARHGNELMSIEGVVGIGIGECKGNLCFEVYLEDYSEDITNQIPKQIEGVEVSVKVTGPIKAEEQKFEKIITTRAGDLKLKYENGKATLSGALSRSTPCVDWQIIYGETSNIHPPKSVEFNIFNKNKDVICIQVLGEPQNISAELTATEETHYTVKLEDEVVFTGTLREEDIK